MADVPDTIVLKRDRDLVGRRAQNVQLLDGDTPILSIKRTVTVFP